MARAASCVCACTEQLGTRWLIPRMGRFFESHPEVTVSFTTRLPGVIDFRREGIDAAIHVGEERGRGSRFIG